MSQHSLRVGSLGRFAKTYFVWLVLLIGVSSLFIGGWMRASPLSAQGATATPSTSTQAAESCADAAAEVSMIETPLPPVTPTATATSVVTATATTTPTAATTPLPTATLRPAPQTDRVGPLENYPDDWHLMYIHDRGTNGQVRIICGNDIAVSGTEGEPFPYGTVLVMETWTAKPGDEPGVFALDEDGRFIRQRLLTLHAMRKEEGFGEDYESFRSGEWEYMGYNPDMTVLNPPQTTGVCADCHSSALSEDTDWTFRAMQFYDDLNTQILPGTMQKVRMIVEAEVGYGPNQLMVAPGTTVIFSNLDLVPHNVTFRDGSVDSGRNDPGSSFSMIMNTPGTYAFFCNLHPRQMTGTITVTED